MHTHTALPGSRLALLVDAIRSYPAALARQLVECKPGDPNLTKLNERYRMLTPMAQLQCRAEMLECREAIRGNRPV